MSHISVNKKNSIEKMLMLKAFEWSALVASLFLLPLVGVMLRFCGIRVTRKVLSPRRVRHSSLSLSDQLAMANQISRMVNIAVHRSWYKADCLRRSFVLFSLLRRRGIACELIYGTHVNLESFSAHAWVELEGVVLNDQANVRETFSAFE